MNGVFQDRELTCVECDRPFFWTAGEQQFYAKQGFSDPKRCGPCRQAKRSRYEAGEQ